MIYGLNDRLNEAIKKSGMNLSEISKKANITRHMLWQYRNYGITPSVAVLARLAVALDVSMDWLVGIGGKHHEN